MIKQFLKIPNKSFTLVEVLIFITILSLFFVAAVSVLTVSVRNLKISEHKIIATRYAEELAEWIRGEKEADWANLIGKFSGSTVDYCFNNTTLDWSTPGICPAGSGFGNQNYSRQARLTKRSISGVCADCQVDISITVSWTELGNNYQVPLQTTISIWESKEE